ncbi:response regulator [Comamonas resistens]|uniref:Response regulator n=1 Tax=Comamonas resistens TaxID=3046670 RepID=A0ABY8SNG2_9BURK|nr:response regulator [Comamonas resistens]MDL5038481.1 response regulator [Comamonas resistens]WHS64632.1 response regulator [Comamonas resistens]
MKLRTYFVEDNPTIRENLIATLAELADVEAVGTADTELDATHWLTQNADAWDLVVVDLFLRQGSGLGVVNALQARSKNQKLLVLSNYATPDVRERCQRLNADAIFDKSNEIDGLVDFCIDLNTNKV